MSETHPHKNGPWILVTGAAGLFGSRICRDLGRDHRVVGLDTSPRDFEGGPEQWIECDLTDDASVEQALASLRSQQPKLASVVHLAAYYDFSGEPSPLYDELTVEGTRRLLRGLRDFEVEQFLFSSSLLVMKAVEPGQVIDESSALEAEWDYPRSKLAAEEVIREEHGQVPAVILRIAGAYDEDCHSIPIAQQMRRIFEEKLESYVFPGDPRHGQSFVHLDDVVRCVRAAVERRGDLGQHEVFLIGESDVVSYGEMQDAIGHALHGVDWPTIRVPAPVAKAGAWVKDKLPGEDSFIKPWMIDLADAHLPISARRAEQRLGWKPQRSLRDELPAMADRLLSDPERWYRENGIEPPDDLEKLIDRRTERMSSR